MDRIELRCPNCLGFLLPAENGYCCSTCNIRFETIQDIPVLTTNKNFYYGEIPKEDLISILDDIKTYGWEVAVKRYTYERKSTYWLNYALDERRVAWKYLMDFGDNKVVLDFGCGWGNISIGLARNCSKVVCVDLTKEKLLFLKHRAAYFGYENIFPIHGGDTDFLPFPTEYFDLVVLNGVLEWVAIGKTGNPRKTQIRFLQEISRVLKRGGQLYIGIENRLNFKYFLGRPDDHSGLKYASLLPRLLANLYSKKVKSQPYKTYTYTSRGYSKMLSDVGFKAVKFFSPLPDYRHFKYIIDLDNKENRKYYFLNSLKEGTNLIKLFKMKYAKLFTPSFGIIAVKGSNYKSVLHYVLNQSIELAANDRKPEPTDKNASLFLSYTVTNNNVVVVRTYGSELIIKIPLNPSALADCFSEERTLKSIHSSEKLISYMKDKIPLCVKSGSFFGEHFFIQTALAGISGTKCILKANICEKVKEEAIKFITHFHRLTRRKVLITENNFHGLFLNTFSTLHTFAHDHTYLSKIQKVKDYLRDALVNTDQILVSVHGDYHLGNLLFTEKGELIGVIDWDQFRAEFFPMTDLLTLLLLLEVERSKRSYAETYINRVFNLKIFERKWIDYYLDHLRIPFDKKFLRLWTIIHWLNKTEAYIRRSFRPHFSRNAARSFYDCLNYICQKYI